MKRSELVLALFLLIAVVVPLAFFLMEPGDSELASAKLSRAELGEVAESPNSKLQTPITRRDPAAENDTESRSPVEPNVKIEREELENDSAEPAYEAATIDVWVVNRDAQSALAHWGVDVVNLDAPDERLFKRTDKHGMVRFEVERGQSYQAIVNVPGTGQVFSEQASDVDDSDGMHAQLFIEVPIPVDVFLEGRVVGEAEGHAVSGADIVIESLESSNFEPIHLISDVDGRFHVSLPRYMKFVASTTAAGWLPNQSVIDGEGNAIDLIVTLMKPAAIDVQVRGADGLVRPDVQVSVWRDRFSTEVSSKAKFGDRPAPRIKSTDSNGVASFENLPTRVVLKVLVDEVDQEGQPLSSYPEFRPQEQKPRSIILNAGERRWVELGLSAPGRIAGRAVTPNGEAVAGHLLELAEAVDGSSDWRSLGRGPGRSSTTTDANGYFQFENVPAGQWWVSSLERESAVESQFVDLRAGDQVTDVRIVVYFDLIIEGTILDPFGKGILADVVASSDKDFSFARSDEAGRFRIEPLLPGIYELVARATSPSVFEPLNPKTQAFSESKPLAVEAGSTGVELNLQSGGVLKVKVVDEQSRSVAGTAWLSNELGVNGNLRDYSRKDFSNGEVIFTGLHPMEYSLFIRAEGRVAVRTELEVRKGLLSEPVQLRAERGASLSVRNESASESILYKLLYGKVVVGAGVAESESSDTFEVPSGVITVQTLSLSSGKMVVRTEQQIDCSTSELAVVRLN